MLTIECFTGEPSYGGVNPGAYDEWNDNVKHLWMTHAGTVELYAIIYTVQVNIQFSSYC